MDVQSAILAMRGMANSPEQQQMLQWLQSQPQEVVLPFLKNLTQKYPLDKIPEMINTHMAHLSPPEKQGVYDSIVPVYNFLSQQ